MKAAAVALFFVGLLSLACNTPQSGGAASSSAGGSEAKPAPELVLSKVDGSGTLALADQKGKVVLVDLWATWCAPCIKEMPSLLKLSARIGGDKVAVVALSQDLNGWPVIGPFLDKNGLKDLPVYFDPEGALARGMGVAVLPTTVILDRDGRMEGYLVGAANWDSDDAVKLIRYYADAKP
jgi:thiol-disulfide isomerase/thioredoxin